MRKSNQPAPKSSVQPALQALTNELVKVLARTETPIPAATLKPLLETIAQLGDSLADQIIERLAEKFADKLMEKFASRMGGLGR